MTSTKRGYIFTSHNCVQFEKIRTPIATPPKKQGASTFDRKNADDDFSQFERLLEGGVEKVKEAIKSLHQDEPVQAENFTTQSIKDQMKQFHDSENVTPKNSGYKK